MKAHTSGSDGWQGRLKLQGTQESLCFDAESAILDSVAFHGDLCAAAWRVMMCFCFNQESDHVDNMKIIFGFDGNNERQ